MKAEREAKGAPTHPGALLRAEVIPPLNLTQDELAKRLRVSRRTVSQILNERRPLTVDLALRLSRLTGHDPRPWLEMQLTRDLWELQGANDYGRIRPLKTSA